MAGERWREPASFLTLRWGTYRGRYVLALALILAGGLVVQAASVYATYFIGIGLGAHILGWLLLPSIGVRRVTVAVPSALCAAGPLIGSLGSVLLVLCLLGWLWTRQRPGMAYLVLIFPVISAVILSALFPQYGHGIVVVAVSAAVVVGSAWLARTVAKSRQILSATR